MRIATVYYERYLIRRKAFEVSLPIEFGYGHSRYEINDEQSNKHEVARGVFLPLGVGVSAAYQFPTIRWLRPLHWFGLNILTGYRFILKERYSRKSNQLYWFIYISWAIVFPRKSDCGYKALAAKAKEETDSITGSGFVHLAYSETGIRFLPNEC